MRPLLAILLALAGCGAPPAKPKPPAPVPVVLAAVEPAMVERTIPLLAEVEAEQGVVLACNESGTVLRIAEGTAVAAGEVVAQLDDARERAALAEAGTLAADAADRLAARRRLAAGEVSADELERLAAAAAAAQARRDAAEAALAQRRVVAPFAGVLGPRRVQPGERVVAGAPVATLTAPGARRLRVAVPAALAPAAGQLLRLPGGGSAAITAVDAQADPVLRTIRATAPADTGIPGTALPVALVVERAERPTVPDRAVVRSGARAWVWTVETKDGATVARRVTVTAGLRHAGRIAIDALPAGAQVIVEGVAQVRDGMPIAVTK